ncbi:hypothetical protein SALWKB12_0031 [Snodgrassella communis]|nr:hypothetical protein SALWKB12_0031 [Snodgrassella communis]
MLVASSRIRRRRWLCIRLVTVAVFIILFCFGYMEKISVHKLTG